MIAKPVYLCARAAQNLDGRQGAQREPQGYAGLTSKATTVGFMLTIAIQYDMNSPKTVKGNTRAITSCLNDIYIIPLLQPKPFGSLAPRVLHSAACEAVRNCKHDRVSFGGVILIPNLRTSQAKRCMMVDCKA